MKFIFKIAFILCFFVISFSLLSHFLKPIFLSNSIIIPYGLQDFDICQKHPVIWNYIKLIYIFFYSTSTFIISNSIFSKIFHNISFSNKSKSSNTTKLHLRITKDIIIEDIGLYQNFLITGTIGSGKTSSAMYPFSKQLISYKCNSTNEKLGMLILDVKGNFYVQIKKFADFYNRDDDLIIIELGGNVKYNPLHKPHLKANVLANRLKTILTLFSTNNSDSYWIDKAETAICEAIKICRIYNNGYVTFSEIHKIISFPNYLNEKREQLKKIFQTGLLSQNEIFDISSAIDFFENEFNSLDTRIVSIIKSEITRITGIFVNDLDINNTFCSDINDLTFTSFNEVIQKGKIVVLNMNIAEYDVLSKIIATYLKLDFQTEVISSLTKGYSKPCAFICDEYHQYVTSTDADFFSESREAKCINIVATQSYSSIINTLKDINSTKVIIQSLVNKFWFRTDDTFTIEEIQKQIGKEDKIRKTKSISENANSVSYNYFLNDFLSHDSSFSESISTYVQNDYIYDTNFFTQKLETFSCLAFLSDGNAVSNYGKINMIPYFKQNSESEL